MSRAPASAAPHGRRLGEIPFGHLRLRLTDHRAAGDGPLDGIAWALVDPAAPAGGAPCLVCGFADDSLPAQLRALADAIEVCR